MKTCDACGTRIFLGGVKDGGRLFCNAKCHQDGVLLDLTRQVSPEELQHEVEQVHAGPCPLCSGPGPVDVHSSYRVWSILVFTRYTTFSPVGCRSCGIKRQLGDLTISLLF